MAITVVSTKRPETENSVNNLHAVATGIHWLRQRRIFNITLIISYFLLVVLPHEIVGKFIADRFRSYTRDQYNFTILVLGIFLLIVYVVPLVVRLVNGNDRKLKWFYLILTIGLIIAATNTIVVVNVEFIHLVQYGLMALLLFPLTLRYGETLFWTVLMGATDEAYQYFYLAPQRTEYYDFNDIVINLLGGALGLVSLRIFDVGQLWPRWQLPFNRRIVVAVALIGGVVLSIFTLGWFRIYPDDGSGMEPLFLLVRKAPTAFWSVIPPEIVFHIIEPLEGIVMVVLLLLIYQGLAVSKTQTTSGHFIPKPTAV